MKFPTKQRHASLRSIVADGAKQRPDFDCTGIVGAPVAVNARKIVAWVWTPAAAGAGDALITTNSATATRARAAGLTG